MEEKASFDAPTEEVILNKTLTLTQQECTRLLEENRALRRILGMDMGLCNAIANVAEFHAEFGMPILDKPKFPSPERLKMRWALVEEEVRELDEAIYYKNMVEVADGIADSIYVLIGLALEMGIPLAEVWREVQRSNMDKVGGPVRGDGKILKPEGWVGPKIKKILEEYQ